MHLYLNYKMFYAGSLFIKLMRPYHWVKNLLIFAPLFFYGQFFDFDKVFNGLILFLVFSLLASCVYIVNDIFDREKDSVDSNKKNRPIASGKITVFKAVLFLVFLLFLSIIISLKLYYLEVFNSKILFALLLYFVLNLFYSVLLKHVVILEFLIVAFFYLLRILLGGELWSIRLSHWIILCTFFLALFLIIGKRRTELLKKSSRPVLSEYTKELLDYFLLISVSGAVLTYSLYASFSEKKYLLYSLLIVLFSLFRYLYLIVVKTKGDNPERLLFKDFWLFCSIISWIFFVGFVYYFI